MIGQIFGRLTVLEVDEEKTKEKEKIYFKCKCACDDKIISVRKDSLVSKTRPTRSCGCLNKETTQFQGIKNRENLIGYKTGKLTVISYNEEISKEHGRPYWNVKCDCGTRSVISAIVLKKGQFSCDCVRSKGELLLGKTLEEMKISYKKEYSFEDLLSDFNVPLRFDYFLPDYNTLIECQGQQHYNPIEQFGGQEAFKIQLKYDGKKKKYCKEKRIKLFEIPYWDYNKIDKEYILNFLKIT